MISASSIILILLAIVIVLGIANYNKLIRLRNATGVLVETYPELKADRNMREFAEELTSTGNRIGFSRQAYNDNVLQYNDAALLQATQSAAERSASPVRF